jgi:hypothetical protein
MTTDIILSSIQAFHLNGINGLIYSFSANWCLIILLSAAVLSVILGVTNESASVVREEQNIL